MQRIFITGASGFLGRYLIERAPDSIHILAQFQRHPIPVASPNVTAFQVDITAADWKEVIDFQPEVIIHAAAMTSLDECERQPQQAREINVASTIRLVQAAQRINARFIFISTDQIFDGKKSLYVETDPPTPLSVYGQTKVDAEKFLLTHLKNGVSARCALIYGRALHGRPTFTEAMYNKLCNDDPVKLFVDEYRTPILVQNLADALWELAGNDFRGIIHLGGAQRLTRYELGEIMCRMFNFPTRLLVPTRLAEVNLPAPRPLDCSLNISLAKSVLRTRLVDCEEGLRIAFGDAGNRG